MTASSVSTSVTAPAAVSASAAAAVGAATIEAPAKQKIIVFVDTSYLSRRPKADWQRLLKVCQDKKIEIHISYIVAEEYRTQHRDYLLAKIEDTKAQWDILDTEYRKNPMYELLGGRLTPLDFLPTAEKIEELSSELMKNLIDDYRVKIIEPSDHHALNVWKNYFNWEIPFNRPNQLSKLSDTRENRRKDIPDAWIYESALDLLKTQHRVFFLCNDGNLKKSLKDRTSNIFSTGAEILKIIEPPEPPPNPAPVPAPVPQTSADAQSGTNAAGAIQSESLDLESVIKKIYEQEKMLQVRILGHVYWYDPISKADLANLLGERGYSASLVENIAQQSVLSGYIKDTGSNYIPQNEALCEQAANSIMPELLEILDK